MEKENVINYIIENIEQIENAKSDYAFSNIKVREILAEIYAMVSLIDKRPKGEWLRMSNLSEQEDDRYECSNCGNVVHYKDKVNLYTFNRWCGRCGSNNGRKMYVSDNNAGNKKI